MNLVIILVFFFFKNIRDAIVMLTDDMTIGHYLVEPNGSLTELTKVKLSSQNAKNGQIAWAGGSGLAIITGKQ